MSMLNYLEHLEWVKFLICMSVIKTIIFKIYYPNNHLSYICENWNTSLYRGSQNMVRIVK